MDGGIMADMQISPDFGLRWGNVVITPEELANHIIGIELVDGGMELDGVKFCNIDGREFIADQLGKRHRLPDLIERIQSGDTIPCDIR